MEQRLGRLEPTPYIAEDLYMEELRRRALSSSILWRRRLRRRHNMDKDELITGCTLTTASAPSTSSSQRQLYRHYRKRPCLGRRFPEPRCTTSRYRFWSR